jgi:transcriptional regulator with XRE-family HTH domain
MLIAAQCRAARALLDISRDALAERAGVASRTIADFESGKREPINATKAAIRAALETDGVEFIRENGGGAGVRLRKV